MDITPRIPSQSMVVQSYKSGQFKISGQSYDTNVIVFAENVIPWQSSSDIASLCMEDFASLIEAKKDGLFDVLLLGTGADFQFLDPVLKNALHKQGISPDLMNTGAACRTFNTLLADGRKVCAAMIRA